MEWSGHTSLQCGCDRGTDHDEHNQANDYDPADRDLDDRAAPVDDDDEALPLPDPLLILREHCNGGGSTSIEAVIPGMAFDVWFC